MAYEGISIPKIYQAQMPQQSSGGDIVSRLLPSLASAYISGMRQEEANQLRADTTLYSSLAKSAANYKTSEEVKGVLDRLIEERKSVAESGDAVRASYLDANIAAVQPYYNTQLKREDAQNLIDAGIKEFEQLENTPGYSQGALKLYEEWDNTLSEYDEYFTPRMIKDVQGAYDEMNLRLSALSVLDALDSDGVDAEGKPIKLDGIQINPDKFPNEKSLYHAQAANELLTRGLATPQADKKLISQGLSQFAQMQNDLGVANAIDLKAKQNANKLAVDKIRESSDIVSSKLNFNDKDFDKFYPGAVSDIKGLLTRNLNAVLKESDILDKQRIKQIRNVVVHDLGRILENTDNIDDNLNDLLKEWAKAGYRKDTIILDEIYDKLSYWNPTSVVSYDDYINELDYPGLGGTDKNVQDLVFSYLGFLDNLQQEETKLAKTWEGSYSQASANQINNQMETNLSNLLNP